jgi:hypothetical protein
MVSITLNKLLHSKLEVCSFKIHLY